MKVIYLGYVVPNYKISQRKAVSIPANSMALGIIKGLKDRYNENFICFSIEPIEMYPKNKKIKVRSLKLKLLNECYTNTIGYINFPILKQLSIIFNLFRKLLKLVNSIDYKNEKIVIITVNSNSILSLPSIWLKMIFHVKLMCYASDMPYDSRNLSGIKKIGVKIDNYFRINNLKKYDSAITFVAKCIDDFMPNKPYIVIDHIYDEDKYNNVNRRTNNNNKYSVIYTGSLNDNYRINEIIEAFKILPSNYEMVFYGKGPLENLVKQVSQKFTNIRFGGFIENEKIPQVQAQADILISLLNTDKPISKYAIPSKIIGYLASGVPIISSQASSIPIEYRDFINYVDSEDSKSIAKKVLEILDNQNLKIANKKALQGKEYVIRNCKWSEQVKKIIDFIDNYETQYTDYV